jgi:hypothetical protein
MCWKFHLKTYITTQLHVWILIFSDEFDIIPAIKPENESCPFVLDKTKLGIFSWCVKDLFCYVYTELKAARKCNTTTSHKEGTVTDYGSFKIRIASEIWPVHHDQIMFLHCKIW